MTLLYLFHLVWLILLLTWDSCGRLSHKPKCCPLLLFPTASGITLAPAMQGNCTTSFAATSHTGQRPRVRAQDFQKISPMASEHTHMPRGAPSGKTSQTPDLPDTSDRTCLSFPHDKPAGESWDRGLKLFKHLFIYNIFLSWSCRVARDSGAAHQPGVDLVKCLLLFLGYFWTQR